MSKGFILGWLGAAEVMVDPSDVIINAAGTNMQVAIFPEGALSRGDKRPEHVNFRSLQLEKKDYEALELVFKQKQAEQKKKTRALVNEIRVPKKLGHANLTAVYLN